MRPLLPVFLYILITQVVSYGQAQTTVSGSVYAKKSNTPIPMAIISLENDSHTYETVCSFEGVFNFDNIPLGTYKVMVSAMGYKDRQLLFTLDSLENKTLHIFLENEMIDEVIIENDVLRKKKEAGFAVEEIETKNLQHQSIELNTVLDQSAGIRVRREGGLGSRVNYSINGLSGRAIRFFLDGIPMDYFGSSYSINTIPVSLIDRIEVYKGVVPVELGGDALGGAINLITKKRDRNSLEASYSFGSFNTHRASLFGRWRDKSTGITTTLSTFYNYSDNNYHVWGDDVYVTDPNTFEIKRDIKVRRFHDSFESMAIKAALGFTQKKWANQFFIGILHSNMDKDIQHGPTMEVPFGEATYHQKVIMPHLTYQKYDFLIKGLDMNLFSAYSNLERTRVDTSKKIYNWYGDVEGYRTIGGEQANTLNTLTEKVLINRINTVFHFNDNHKIGYNYVVNALTRTDRDPILTQKTEGYWSPQKLNKHTMGLALQSEWLGNKLHTSLFAKYYAYNAAVKLAETRSGITTYSTVNSNTSNLGYGIASSYKLTTFLSVNTSFEKAYRLPESNEILGDGLSIKSTTELEAEESRNINMGFSFKLLKDKVHGVNISLNGFYRDITNLIQQQQYDLGAFVYINIDKVEMKGLDGKLSYRYKELITFSQNISYLNPIIKSDVDENGDENFVYNTRVPNKPFFQSSTDIRFNFENLIQKNSNLFLYWTINYVGKFHRHSEDIGNYNKDVIPAQFINNCGIGYSFPTNKLTLSFDANNLFNEQAFDNFAIQKPGRAFYAKVTYRII